MTELREIVEAAGRAAAAGVPAVLATVVRVAGSTYRRPGARMLLVEGRDPLGLVSGGCLEADLAERAGSVLDSGRARTVVYDMRSPDDIVWGLGLGCNGEVRVLLERLDPERPPDYMTFVAECLRARRPGVVATAFAGPALGRRLTLDDAGAVAGTLGTKPLDEAASLAAHRALAERRSGVEAHADVEFLVEFVPPVVSLWIFGSGGDVPPLVRLAASLGWRVTVADDRPATTREDRFPEAVAVRRVDFDSLEAAALPIDAYTPVIVMTHHFLKDLAVLERLLPSPAPYLGLLGPRQRARNLLEELGKRGVVPPDDQLARVFGPVGLDIGSETPEEIALSALAEMQAVLGGGQAGFLRDRTGPLHEWPR